MPEAGSHQKTDPETVRTDLASLAQAFLFTEGGTLSFKKLAQLMNTDDTQVAAALETLSSRLAGSGLSLIRSETEATLAVAPAQSEVLRVHYEKELGAMIGDAGLEVLAILLYRGPSTRAEIDYIRGVNTSSTIRTLIARGLIERGTSASGSREYAYRPTAELLAHIGATDLQDVPEYGTISNELQAFEDQQNQAGPFTQENHEYDSGVEEKTSGTTEGAEKIIDRDQ